MKYEEPKLWITEMQKLDVITLSSESNGSGGEIDSDIGGWG